MHDDNLMSKVQRCLKDLSIIRITLSKSEDNKEKYINIRDLLCDVLYELAQETPDEEKVRQACAELKDIVGEYNDSGDNLDIKKASRGFATKIGTIDPQNYKEFLDNLILEDKEDVVSYLYKDVHTSEPSPDDLVKQAWESYQGQRYDDAFKFAYAAKKEGAILAYPLLGILYSSGEGVTKDMATAYSIFLEGAQKGNSECKFQVYLHLFYGKGVEKNVHEAYKWLYLAALDGHPLAMLETGKVICNSGVTEQYNEAYSWFEKAASADVEEAKAWVGYCYEMGYGVQRDIQQAKEIYRREMYKGNQYAKVFYDRIVSEEKKAVSQSKSSLTPSHTKTGQNQSSSSDKGKNKNPKGGGYSWLFFLILLVGIIVAAYYFWYKDYRIDKAAPRTYVYATNLFLRSSEVADVEYNRISTIPYGSELITYSNENGWAYVKVDGKKGYVASDYLLTFQDFHLLNGVWGNEDAKELVSTAKCRLAVLDFLRRNNMQTGITGWQLYTKQKEMKPNSVLYPQLNDGYENFTEFAFILKDNQSNNRKLALYSFEENENPVFRYMEDAPNKGDIKSITYTKWNDKYKVTYSNQESDYVPQVKKEKEENIQPVHSISVSITSAVFANTDYNNNILTEYGSQLYSDMQYLTAKLSYKKPSENSETITLFVKIITPTGTLVRSNNSPTAYTFKQDINLLGKEGVFQMLGWGNNAGNFYVAGNYQYEIWHDGTKLYSTLVNVKNKQNTKYNEPDNQVYESVDKMPEFYNGGIDGLMGYLSENIKYPTIAQEKGIQGRVVVQFIVNKDGSIENAQVLKSVDPHLDREALRVVKSMPKWKPGEKEGKAVRVKYILPINFKLT